MMTIFDLVFRLAIVGCVLALVALGSFLLRRHGRLARRVALALGSFLALYAGVLLSVSFLSPQVESELVDRTRFQEFGHRQ